jgi:hypothetical protein
MSFGLVRACMCSRPAVSRALPLNLQAAGVNLFDIAWGAVAPVPATYNLSASSASIECKTPHLQPTVTDLLAHPLTCPCLPTHLHALSCIHPPALSHQLARTLTHSFTRSLTPSLTHSPLTRSLSHSRHIAQVDSRRRGVWHHRCAVLCVALVV